MNSEEHDQLWELLGKVPEREVSPFFAANVLRQVRQTQQSASNPFLFLLRRWQLVSLSGVAALLVMWSFSQTLVEPDEPTVLAEQVTEPIDYEIIADLEELLAYEDGDVWLDPNTF